MASRLRQALIKGGFRVQPLNEGKTRGLYHLPCLLNKRLPWLVRPVLEYCRENNTAIIGIGNLPQKFPALNVRQVAFILACRTS